MAALGAINCLYGARNTGVPTCFCDPKFIQGALLVPKGTTLTTTTVAAFQTALSSLVYNASKTSRGYPIYDFEAPKDSTEAKTIQTMPTGQKHVVREGYNDWSFQFVNGGLSLNQALRAFNGINWDFYFVDNDPQGQKIFGITGATANTLQAFPSSGGFFWTDPWKLNDGSKITEYMLQFVFNTKYANDLVNYIQLPTTFDFPTQLPGLNDVVVTASATVNATAKNFNISLVSPTGVDIGALNSTALSGAGVSNWTASVVASGLPIVVSTSTWVPSTVAGVPGYFTLVLATTNYPTPPAPVYINLVSATTLQAAGILYESTGALSIASV